MARATKPAQKPANGILQVRLADGPWEELLAYCHEHDLALAEAVRVGLGRLGKKAPSKAERAAAGGKMGNPNFGRASEE